MKNVKILSILLLTALTFSVGYAQTTKADKKAARAATIKRILNDKSYVFTANYVMPMSMSPRALTSTYDVTVNKDSLDVYLPYFGRAYTAPIDATQGGFKMTSTKFNHIVAAKKSGWEITIKPKDAATQGVRDIQSMMLSVSADGYATLRITSLSKQPISFNGTVDEIKKRK